MTKLEHGGLASLTVDNLNEAEYFSLMRNFWKQSAVVEKESFAGEELRFDQWFYQMGGAIFSMRGTDFRCGADRNSVGSIGKMRQVFQTQCGSNMPPR